MSANDQSTGQPKEMREGQLAVEYVSIGDLVPYARNAKEHPYEQIEQIANSIEKFGMNDPVGVWTNPQGELEIVEGHGRVLALEHLGVELCPVIRLDDLTDEERRAYTHVHNQTTLTSGFDEELLFEDLDELDFALEQIRFLGCRGTTGTEASFLELFEGDQEKIDQMNRMIAAEFGFDSCFDVCGQTYPRIVDSCILNALSCLGQACYRMASDIRLMQHDRYLEEPFEQTQVGSSAMAYKRNPMRCERICSLSRYLMVDALNAPMTASAQWLERTLDDSANRRISLPEGFLCADAILRLAKNVTAGLRVNEKIIDRAVREYLPFIATENLLMEAVKRGGDRQAVHEIIRQKSMEATARMKEGGDCDLLSRLAAEPAFGMTEAEMTALLEPGRYTGRCAQQVTAFLELHSAELQNVGMSSAEITV